MPIDSKLLDILCCPETKTDVEELSETELNKLNTQIKNGKVFYKSKEKVNEPFSEGLITIDKKTVYRIEDEIPIMLIDKAIAFDQL